MGMAKGRYGGISAPSRTAARVTALGRLRSISPLNMRMARMGTLLGRLARKIAGYRRPPDLRAALSEEEAMSVVAVWSNLH
jgi:hypothetical protein